MIKSIELNKNFQYNALEGKKVPHSISQPVIHYENGKYYISAFVFFYNKEDIQSGMVNRPTLWIIADINTGEIIERRNTNDIDFSDAPYDIKYNIQMTEKCDTSRTYYEETFELLDIVRNKLINYNLFDSAMYGKYLTRILNNIPESYKRFFIDLSI